MALSAGTRLGPYEILEPIGAGGMGEVYMARDTRLDRVVAIKTSKAQFTERFEREARAVAALNHPNICTLHDVGPNYLVMEYVEGRPLSGPLPPKQAFAYAVQIVTALVAAHAKVIVHRDLKPASILVTETGVKLLDFGLAKQLLPSHGADPEATRTQHTVAGAVLGTPAYMSPEQARGEQADERSDIFSFGAVFYETLTGERALQGFAATARKRLPHAAARIMDKALAPDRARRYQTADEVLADLRKWGARTPRRRILALAYIAAGLALLGSVGYLVYERPINPTSIRSIAVRPLKSLSEDASQRDFVDGLTDALATDLSRVRALNVTRSAGSELSADAMLQGSVSRSGTRIRIVAELVQTKNGSRIWSATYDRNITDLFAVEHELAAAISGAVRAQLGEPERKRLGELRAVNSEGYDLYLRGRYHAGRWNENDIDQAIQLLEKAVGIDPTFEPAQAELASVYAIKSAQFQPRDPQLQEKGFAAVEKALALDPNAPEAHFARGMMLWQPVINGFASREALTEYRQVIAHPIQF